MSSHLRIYGGVTMVVMAAALGYATAPRPTASLGGETGAQAHRVLTESRGQPPIRSGSAARAPYAPYALLKSGADVRTALMNGITIHDMFEREERDDRWASKVEAVFRDRVTQYQRDVLPYATSPSFECRSSSCQMAIVVPADRFQEASALAQSLPLGRSFQPHIEEIEDQPGHVRVTLTVIFPEDQIDVAEIRAYFETGLAQRFPHGFPWVRRWLDEHPDAVSGKDRRGNDHPQDEPR